MSRLSSFLVCGVVASLVYGCAHVASYQLSLNERSRVFECDVSTAVAIVTNVFVEYGFEIAHVDSSTGAIYTRTKTSGKGSDEIGGTTRSQWTAAVESVPSGAVVYVQYLVENKESGEWADSSFELNKLRSIYVRLFREIESRLDKQAKYRVPK